MEKIAMYRSISFMEIFILKHVKALVIGKLSVFSGMSNDGIQHIKRASVVKGLMHREGLKG